jgi:ribonuclease HII
MTLRAPTLSTERALFAEGYRSVGAMDEVGRGSAVGPCCVGLVVIGAEVGPVPAGLRDSKLLSASQREALVAPIEQWSREHVVGFASAREIDDFGLTWGLRLAGLRALSALSGPPDIIVLDGRHDWLSLPSPSFADPTYPDVVVPEVRTMIKADLTSAAVAAASVVAKVRRDDTMRLLAREVPGYDIERNMGYVTAAHQAALRRLGPSPHHRISWRLPAQEPTRDVV